MKPNKRKEIERIGGDLGDPVWLWFVHTGPHGPWFTWHQTRKEPPGYIGVEHLEKIVVEMQDTNPLFPAQARTVVQKALLSEDLDLLRRAIQVAAVVGGEEELQQVSVLTAHEVKEVSADAKASAFYLQKRLGTP